MDLQAKGVVVPVALLGSHWYIGSRCAICRGNAWFLGNHNLFVFLIAFQVPKVRGISDMPLASFLSDYSPVTNHFRYRASST